MKMRKKDSRYIPKIIDSGFIDLYNYKDKGLKKCSYFITDYKTQDLLKCLKTQQTGQEKIFVLLQIMRQMVDIFKLMHKNNLDIQFCNLKPESIKIIGETKVRLENFSICYDRGVICDTKRKRFKGNVKFASCN